MSAAGIEIEGYSHAAGIRGESVAKRVRDNCLPLSESARSGEGGNCLELAARGFRLKAGRPTVGGGTCRAISNRCRPLYAAVGPAGDRDCRHCEVADPTARQR